MLLSSLELYNVKGAVQNVNDGIMKRMQIGNVNAVTLLSATLNASPKV